MKAKLTLTLEQDIIKRAKAYAKDNNRSLSNIIENYLKFLTEEEKVKDSKQLNPVVTSLKGSFKMPKNMDYKKELKNRLEDNYL